MVKLAQWLRVVIFGLSEDAGHWSEALRVRQTRWRSVFDAVLAVGARAPKEAGIGDVRYANFCDERSGTGGMS
jgi:hypothetical protein